MNRLSTYPGRFGLSSPPWRVATGEREGPDTPHTRGHAKSPSPTPSLCPLSRCLLRAERGVGALAPAWRNGAWRLPGMVEIYRVNG
eukprot:5773887-Prymnesium_polylepis.2